MTELLKRIRCQVGRDCLVKRLSKDGCKVKMTGAPAPNVIIDLDKPGSPLEKNEVRCDYILVAEGGRGPSWVAVLELKKGKLHTDKVVRQLRAGAAQAMKFVPKSEAARFRFQPIAVSGSRHIYDRQQLKNKANRIKFHGQSEPVRLMSCGAQLAPELCD